MREPGIVDGSYETHSHNSPSGPTDSISHEPSDDSLNKRVNKIGSTDDSIWLLKTDGTWNDASSSLAISEDSIHRDPDLGPGGEISPTSMYHEDVLFCQNLLSNDGV